MQAFETGAKTAAANNLVLCVTNTAEDYKLRQHAGFAALAHGYQRGYRAMRELAQTRANVERKEGRGRFSAASISDAAAVLLATAIDDAKESILSNWSGESIIVTGRKWFDNSAGNTYHSVQITVPTNDSTRGRLIGCPLQYGYGDQWKWTGIYALRALGFSFPESVPWYEYPIVFEDQGHMNKNCAFDGMCSFSF